MVNDEANPYDEVPYGNWPYPQTHVNRLATVATLFGMQPQPIGDCRVLELGCASGGNLIPMAAALPNSRFVGIDLSMTQIDVGRSSVEHLGLKNIEFNCRSILDVSEELGQFDYIICHGVWSWVPTAVREKILAICQEQLTPLGVAYVSYNAYPGWHMRETVREMMVYHTRKLGTPKEKSGHARALLDFLVRSVSTKTNAYSLLLKAEMQILSKMDDSYLLHEQLEDENQPMYFYEFEALAAARGLQYLGEADVSAMLIEELGSDVDKILDYLATTLVEREQYMDFLRNRMFRQTLLCRKEHALNFRPDYARVRRLYFASPVVEPEGNLAGSSKETAFKALHGIAKTTDPGITEALRTLAGRWPETVRLEELMETVQSRLEASGELNEAARSAGAELIAKGLLDCYVKGFVEIYAQPPPCKQSPGDRPEVSLIVRWQASDGAAVTNLKNQVIQLEPLERQVAQLCDGTRIRDELLDGLVQLTRTEVIVLRDSAGASPGAAQLARSSPRH